MARATVSFRVRPFTKEIICDATNQDELLQWLDDNTDEWADSLVTRADIGIEDAEYDEKEEEGIEEEEIDK